MPLLLLLLLLLLMLMMLQMTMMMMRAFVPRWADLRNLVCNFGSIVLECA
jgi:hypothetical protein